MVAAVPGCVVLAYGSEGLHQPLVESLLGEGLPSENIVIVHNPAVPGERPPEDAPDGVTVLSMERNLGYAGGMNAGIRHFVARRVDWILLLTNDVRFHPGAFQRLLEAAAGAEGYGFLGPVLRASDNRLYYGGRRDTRGRVRFTWKVPDGEETAPIVETDWIQGSALLGRRDVFDQIGLLDESFFMYFEESDLCLRAARAGWRIGVVLLAQAEQQHGHLKRPALHAYLMARNGPEYFLRAGGPLAVAMWLWRQVPSSWELLKVWRGRRSAPPQRRQAHATLVAKGLGTAAFFARRSGVPPAWLWNEEVAVLPPPGEAAPAASAGSPSSAVLHEPVEAKG